jgi:hypothetical protein
MHDVQSERAGTSLTPESVHAVAQHIRHFRELLGAEERWLRSQARHEMISERFRIINFWRSVLNHAEHKLSR